MLITDFNRSLGQGNIFTSVCHSVHRGGGWLPSRSHDQEVSIQGVSLQGGSASRGVGRLPQLGLRVGGGRGWADNPQNTWDTVNKGPYASYWNAFLFSRTYIPFLFRCNNIPVGCVLPTCQPYSASVATTRWGVGVGPHVGYSEVQCIMGNSHMPRPKERNIGHLPV